MDYTRYYIPIIVQLCAYAGFAAGGNWVFVGIASLPLLGLIDSVLSNDMKPRTMRAGFMADLPVWLSTFLAVGMYFMAANWIAREPNATGLQIAGGVLSLAWMSVVPLVASAHELYHQRGKFRRFVGRYSQVCYLDCTREIAHVTGHHLDVATPDDGDTAARGVSLYAFTGKAVIESTKQAWRLESDSLEKQGYGRWSFRHRLWKAVLAQLIMQSIVFAIGGWAAVALVLGGMVGARFWVESFNYFQHYGLIRLKDGAISRRHVWNHLKPLSRVMGFEITNHADHHTDSFARFHELRPDRQWIPMPSVFVCFFSALIPPLWHNAIIKPALKRWDNEMATPEERELAKAQNKAAGWPDWFDQTSDSGHMAPV
ncbi:monooxygenase [Sphingomonadales bacterium EhC05]|nr:monooxygenase [Sphingomonadales bacterium EhC05]